MKTKFLTLLILIISVSSCVSDEEGSSIIAPDENSILLLKVDYLTNVFEEGKELTFDDSTSTFNVEVEYQEPGDFGGIQLYYQELDEKIFDGTIVWNGTGEIKYPENFQPASSFEVTLTEDFVFPTEGFENVFNPNQDTYNYQIIWSAVQNLIKVREYLIANPDESVKIFLYTPSVGIGNPEEWDWIIILKK